MLRIFFFTALLVASVASYAQVPNKFNYQAVARNSQGQFIPNANINLRLTLLSGSATGTPVFSETRRVTTNNVGLFSVVIGGPGATTTTGNLATVDWSAGNMYLRVEADPLGGTSFVALGSTELVSVPYALYSVNGRKGDPGATGPAGPAGPQGPAGPTGATGPQGPVGNTGPAGPAGPTGTQGPAGPTGPAGSTGPAGPAGPQGPTGPAGTDAQTLSVSGSNLSISGGNTVTLPSGTPGPTGPQGPAGPAGPQGPAGPAGTDAQTLSISGNNLSISGGNTVTLPAGGGSLTLPYSASQASATPPLFVINNTSTTGNSIAIQGTSSSNGSGSGPLSGATAIQGELTPTSGGGFSAALRGINRSTSSLGIGTVGYQAGAGYGVYGEAPTGYGLVGNSTSGYGLYSTSSTGYGAYISSSSGLSLVTGSGDVLVYNTLTAGRTSVGNGNNGVNAYSTAGIGVYGQSTASAGGGMLGEGRYIGVQGSSTGTDPNRQAIRGDNASSSTGYAGVFVGTVGVFGTLSKTAGSFIIDHPLDPDNKFLVHSFVESPDMKNIYDGIVTTDARGEAVVTMPDWFQALNMDFRYQLTCINQFAQAIISKEITGNRFTIRTDKPNVKVSWQVTGTRNDPYARDNRLPVEKMKTGNDRGKYIYPEGYGKGRESSLEAIRGSANNKE